MEKNETKVENKIGIGFAEILTIVFVIFKLLGKITWSWWWVFSPVLINCGIALVFGLVAILIAWLS